MRHCSGSSPVKRATRAHTTPGHPSMCVIRWVAGTACSFLMQSPTRTKWRRCLKYLPEGVVGLANLPTKRAFGECFWERQP